MTATPVAELADVSLAYRLARNRAGSMKEFAINLLRRQVHYEKLWALKGVSLSVQRGELFAVVGPNGAGKSTLMKVLSRVLPPTVGRVVVRGRISPMIELSAGLDPELTTAENILLYGCLLGRTVREMQERINPIAEWAELSDVLDVPVRSYSSGMLARLGFAVASDVEPDVLVVDEVLAVGDEDFQRRSRERIEAMIRSGTSVILVSHQLDVVKRLADRVMWLDKGEVRALGEPDEVIAAYRANRG